MPARTAASALLVFCVAVASFGQERGPDSERKAGLRFGTGVLVGSPTGEFGKNVGTGGGLSGHMLYAAPRGVLGLRVDGSLFLYGSETVRVPISSTTGRISTEVVTDNWVAHLAAGPQLMVPSGPVRPYANAFAGVSYFSTTSELSGPYPFGLVASSTNFDDYAFSWGGGAGILVPMGRGGLSLDLGARYVNNRRVSYLAKGDLRDDGKGGVEFTPRRSEGNTVEFRLGVVFGK